MHAPSPAPIASWLELSAGALAANVATFRELGARGGPSPALGAVLKGNAYGHGLAEVLPLVHPQVDVLYLITPQDALAVRALEAARGLAPRPVLVIGAVAPEEAVALARADVEAVLGDDSWRDMVPALRQARLGSPLRVHVHVDSGLGREGFTPARLAQGALDFLPGAADVLHVVGALSHFANTEDVTEQTYALAQVDAFEAGLGALRASLPGLGPLRRHMAASAASLMLPRARYDALRVGISLYGLWPSSETRLSARLVLGRVMMNHLIIDVTRATHDERPLVATLLGRDGDEVLPMESLAGWADTIHYEVAARLGSHLRRVVVP